MLSLESDVETTRSVLDQQDGPAILVGHSYGGAVITEAGRHDRVAALVYITAFAPDKEESVNTLLSSSGRRPRTELRRAHELFCDFGMRAFAERARVELEATGERARKRNVETPDDLTPQESQISRLVAEGHANKDIASQLFISPNTVEYHLRKIFRKLDVKSRTQLANRMRDGLSDSR